MLLSKNQLLLNCYSLSCKIFKYLFKSKKRNDKDKFNQNTKLLAEMF